MGLLGQGDLGRAWVAPAPSQLLGWCLCSAAGALHRVGAAEPGMLPSSWPCPPLPPRASGPHLASIRKTAAGGQGRRELRGQLKGEAFWECLLWRSSFPTRGGFCWGVTGGCAALCALVTVTVAWRLGGEPWGVLPLLASFGP